MADSLDFTELAADADLTPGEVEHFIAGLAGETTEPLPLVRDVYDALQLSLEERALAIHSSGEKVWEGPFGFSYLTVNPMTPAYKPEHPRWAVVRRMFSASGQAPSGCSVFTMQGLQAVLTEMSAVQKTSFRDFLLGNIPDRGMPSVAATLKSYPAGYFVFGGAEGREPVAFCAPQSSPGALSNKPGTLYFGPTATDMKSRVLDEFSANVRDWGAQNILPML